jgi:beta-hydroxylase
MPLFSPRHLVLAIVLASALFVHLRGRDRFGLLRALTDYTVLLAPYDALMVLFSRVPTSAFVDPAHFPELAPLAEHWREIRDEALRLDDDGFIRAAATYNDAGFNSFFRTGWKRFYLKWYGVKLPSAEAMCPRTMALLATVPAVKAAMFASLPPGARLVRHRDPYAGSLRYHLGLVTPNSPDCYLCVDGERYFWRDGEAVMFDETYIHHAENRTDTRRIILFCDVERPLRIRWLARLNRWFAGHIMRAAATQNVAGEHVGLINRIFAVGYAARARAKLLKQRNRRLYYTLKWVLIGGLIYLLFI